MERTDHTPQTSAAGDSGPLIVPEGTVVDDRYRIVGELGSGGMGIVYRAEHTRLVGRPVALKMLRRVFAGTQDLRPRFEREAHALAALSHPNVVTVTDYGVYGGLPYLTMELVDGQDLRAVLDEGPMGVDRALDIAAQVLEGLAFAHRRGLAHRDLKPANVLLQPLPGGRELAKILDFGFAKFLEPQGEGEPTNLTRSGIGFGTPSYMSPEQATGGDTDTRSDVYSMGVLLFEMLTGVKPFDGELQELVHHHLVAQVPPLNDTRPGCGFSPQLDALIVKAMAKKPANRFADAAEMLAALEAIEEPYSLPRVDVAASTVRADEANSVELTTPLVHRSRDESSVHLPTRRRRGGCLALVGLLLGGGVAVAVWKPELLPAGARDEVEAARDAYTRVEGRVVGGSGEGDLGATVGGSGEAEGPGARPAPEPVEPEVGDEPATGGVEPQGDPGQAPEGAQLGAPIPAAEAAGPESTGDGAQTTAEPTPPPAETGSEPTETGSGTEGPAPATEGEQEAAAVPDPWAQRPFPRSLARLRRRVLGGGRVSDATIRAVREYARDHRDDARPGLLLGHAYVRRAWLSDALERYELAHRLAPEARGDPRMLRNLVWMAATQPPVARRAADDVATIYGAEAADAVERALAAPDLEDAGRTRLEALRARLSGR